MAVLLFLLNLPFLLLFLFVLCGRKKKKSKERTLRTPVKISTTLKTPKMSNEPVKSKESLKSKESQEKVPPPASTLSAEGKPTASNKIPKPIDLEEEETQAGSEERVKEQLLNTFEERDAKIEMDSLKMFNIIYGVSYWNSPDDVFRERMAKDFEETRKFYREHDCRGIPPFGSQISYSCRMCTWYMSDDWAGRLYEEALKNEKRCPDGMKRQLEEDFFLHLQKFDGDLPRILENSRWIKAKERIVEERANKEMDKRLEKTQIEENEAIDGSRQI